MENIVKMVKKNVMLFISFPLVAVIIAVSHKRKTKQMSPSKKGYSSYYNAMWEDGVTLSYINNHIELPKVPTLTHIALISTHTYTLRD